MFLTCVVPGMTAVTAGWPRLYFRKKCAHDVASKSLAQSGSVLPLTRANRLPRRPPSGMFSMIAVPCSCASGKTSFSADRSSME